VQQHDRVMKMRRHRRSRVLLSSTTAVVLAVVLSACGGSDDGDDASTSQSSTSTTESGSSADTKSASLPEDFPDDVPLPPHDTIESADIMAEGTWRLLLTTDLDADGDAIIDEYAAQLTAAGFDVGTSPPIVSGNSETLRIDAVIRPPTITLQVIEPEQ